MSLLKEYGTGISLVLLDIVMPEMNGFEVLEEMNRNHWIEDIPVIMISSEETEAYIRKAYEMGVSDYISRPFDVFVVRRRVSNTMLLSERQKRMMEFATEQIFNLIDERYRSGKPLIVTTNLNPDNLVAVPHRLMGLINSPDTPDWHDAESLRNCVALCKLTSSIHKAELSVPRICGVCGKEFLPDPSGGAEYQNRYRKTCPECRAQGLKAYGERKPKLIATCCVCGKEFAAKAKDQKRCPDCIALHPKWGGQAPRLSRAEET